MIGVDRIGLDALRASETPGGVARKVAREFEAMLVAKLFQAANRPLLEKQGLLDGGQAGRMFRDFFIQEVLRQAGTQGELGLASILERQLQDSPDSDDAGEDR